MARERDEAKRKKFRQEIAHKDPRHLKFLDESGFHRSLTRSYGWAKRKERCVDKVPGNRGKNQSLLAVLGWEGIVAWDIQSGSVKAPVVETFVREKLLPHLKTGETLVLDNASSHQRSLLEPLLASVGCSLMYLPPYSPDFNPIELVWRPVKARVRREEPDNWPALHQAMKEGVEQISALQTQQFFRHCGYLPAETENGPTST